ncbi:Wee1-like protein kinase [Tanacetum coccineum]
MQNAKNFSFIRKRCRMQRILATLGYHDNIAGYNTSRFENERLYIQMELCDQSLSINHSSRPCTEDEALEAMHQLSKVGQAIENNDLSSAGSVLGQTIDADWLKKANTALSQVLFLNLLRMHKGLASLASTDEQPFSDAVGSHTSTFVTGARLLLMRALLVFHMLLH